MVWEQSPWDDLWHPELSADPAGLTGGWAGPPLVGLPAEQEPRELPAVFSFLHLHALSENVCAVYCVLEQIIFLQVLCKSSSVGALCNPLLLRIPPEGSAAEEGRREGKQAGVLSTLKPF